MRCIYFFPSPCSLCFFSSSTPAQWRSHRHPSEPVTPDLVPRPFSPHVIAPCVALVRAKGWQIYGTICKHLGTWNSPTGTALLAVPFAKRDTATELRSPRDHFNSLTASAAVVVNTLTCTPQLCPFREQLRSRSRSLADYCFPTAPSHCSYL